ncbi:MAG: DUF2249 domain-containing protein [Bacteroidetes bacterium]|nr:DUF2249 domain-containing protein [Bacteroidota bacterium]
MILVNENTKIANLLKANPDSLEAIISISPKFEKLRNPFLRKLMAGRTSISQASKIAGCNAEDFFKKLELLGFTIDRTKSVDSESTISQLPEFIKAIQPEKILELDVRPIIETGTDPFKIILENIKTLDVGMVLKLINSFEPTPLIALLEKQGYRSAVEYVDEDTINTYFFKEAELSVEVTIPDGKSSEWDAVLDRFEGKLQTIDVRELEMPQPMLTILDALDKLPKGIALYVYHKRIPVFLLPELAERKFDYRIKEINESEVHLLIFKP